MSTQKEIDKALGKRLKYARDLRDMTQPAMVDALVAAGFSISRDQLASIESGRRSVRVPEVLGYAIVLKLPPEWFFQELPATLRAALDSAIPGLLNALTTPRATAGLAA